MIYNSCQDTAIARTILNRGKFQRLILSNLPHRVCIHQKATATYMEGIWVSWLFGVVKANCWLKVDECLFNEAHLIYKISPRKLFDMLVFRHTDAKSSRHVACRLSGKSFSKDTKSKLTLWLSKHMWKYAEIIAIYHFEIVINDLTPLSVLHVITGLILARPVCLHQRCNWAGVTQCLCGE